ncbi:MAG: hypothetical protein AB7U18_04170 [Dehalococcoidia bacterium]
MTAGTTASWWDINSDRVLEVAAAILLGLATFGSAWCAFEAARWNDEQGAATRAATAARFEAGRRFNLGTQAIGFDASLAADYARAVAEGQTELEAFYRDALIRPEFLPVIDAWLKQVQSGEAGAANLFEDTDYIERQLADARRYDTIDEAATQRSELASQNADGYVQLTVFMAIALFFAGMTANFRTPKVRVALLCVSAAILVLGVVRIFGLPFT